MRTTIKNVPNDNWQNDKRVSLSFVQDLLKRYRSDNTIEPLPHGGGQSAKLSPQQVAVVATLIEEDNDANRSGVVQSTRAKDWCES